MTRLEKPLHRLTKIELSGRYGPDSGRRIAITLLPGNGDTVPDAILLWPAGTRRKERLNLDDVYLYAVRCRVNRELLERARAKKEKKAERLAAERQRRAEKRLTRPL